MILVTGGTGLVGSHLLYHLVSNNDMVKATRQKTSDLSLVKNVFGYYTSQVEKLYNKIIWVEADLNDIPSLEKAFKEVDFVYHCAAFISFNPKDYKKMRRVNINGTTNIVNLCVSNSIKKLCFTSSIATLEKGPGDKYINEADNWNSNEEKSGYSITKYGAEKEIWRASQEGVDVVIVNPGVILGSGFWSQGSGNLFLKIKKGFKFYTDGITGFVDVIDVVTLMIKLMESSVKNERFVVVTSNLSFKELFFKIASFLNVKPPVVKISKNLSEIFWRLDRLKSLFFRSKPLLTKFSARSSQAKKIYSSQKIKSLFNFEFREIDCTIERICKNIDSNISI